MMVSEMASVLGSTTSVAITRYSEMTTRKLISVQVIPRDT